MAALVFGAPLRAASVVAVSPDTVPVGKGAEVSIQVEDWPAGTQLAIIPGGPYVSHQLPLSAAVEALSSNGEYLFAAMGGGNGDDEIQILAFPQADKARVVSHISIPQGTVTALYYAQDHVLAVVKDFGMLLLDVSVPEQPRIVSQYQQRKVSHAAFMASANDIYLLLGSRHVERVSLQAGKGRRQAAWTLPIPARAVAVRDGLLIAAGTEGVATVKLEKSHGRLLDLYATNTPAQGIFLRDDLVLVNGTGNGLVVFRLHKDGRLQWLGSHNKRGAIDGLMVSGRDTWVRLGGQTLLHMGLKNPHLPSTGLAYRASSAVRAMTAADGAVFVATDTSLERVVFPPKGGEQLSPEGVNLGGSRRGVIRDNILYVADWFSGLHLYDISDPAHLKHLGNYHTPGSSKGVLLVGDYALVGDDDQGLQIMDVSDPAKPRWVSELAPSAMADLGLAYTMDRVGDRLYLADHRGGFHIIDISDMTHPRRLGGFDTPSKSWAIDVVDKVAFVADDSTGLLSFDVSDPHEPKPLGRYSPGGQAEDVVVRGGLAYVAFFNAGFHVVDIRDPQALKPVGHVAVPGNARGIQLVDDLAYVTGWESGLQVLDISSPEEPHIIGHYDTRGSAWGINIQGHYAYVLDWWGGIEVLDVADPTHPRFISRYHARDDLKRLRTRGNYLFAANGPSGLQVFDIKNSLNPIWAKGVDLPGTAQDVWLDMDQAYVALGGTGVAVVDVLDPFYSHEVGRLDTPGSASMVRAWNGYLYVVDSEVGLLVVDVREPSRPREVARYPYRAKDLWLDEGRLYLAQAKGLAVYTLAGDGRLDLEAQYPLVGGASQVRTQGGLIAVEEANRTVHLLQLEAGQLLPQGSFNVGENWLDMQLTDGAMYLVGAQTGLMVVDVQDPRQPRLTTVYPATGRHNSLALAHGAAFLGGESRLASVDLLPQVEIRNAAPGRINLSLPAAFPRGTYHLLAVSPDGERRWYPDAIQRQRAGHKKGGNGLDAIRRLLKGPLKEPDGL